MASNSMQFDEVLMSLAGQLGGIEPLLQAFFSFLHRKTDFYVAFDRSLKVPPRMGFPTGAAEGLVLKHFHAFPSKIYGEEVARLQPAQAAPTPKIAAKINTAALSPAAPNPTTLADGELEKPSRAPAAASADAVVPAAVAAVAAVPEAKAVDAAVNETEPTTVAASDPASAAAAAETAPAVATAAVDEQLVGVKYSARGKQVPVGNGGVTPHYHWTQTLYEVTVFVPVPKGTRASDLKVTIAPGRLELGFKSCTRDRAAAGGSSFCDASGWLVNGRFPESVKPNDSCWMVEDDPASEGCSVVLITLDKVKRTWWDSVCVGHPEVDTQMVDSTCKMDEYDAETQVRAKTFVSTNVRATVVKTLRHTREKCIFTFSSDGLTKLPFCFRVPFEKSCSISGKNQLGCPLPKSSRWRPSWHAPRTFLVLLLFRWNWGRSAREGWLARERVSTSASHKDRT